MGTFRPMKTGRAAIAGVCGYVPPDVLTNAELAKMVDTTDEWITERTGIKERHILKGAGLGTSHMAAKAQPAKPTHAATSHIHPLPAMIRIRHT